MVKLMVVLLLVASALAAPSTKIEHRLGTTLSTKGQANVLVSFKEKPSHVLGHFKTTSYPNHGARATAVADTLRALAKSSQKTAISVISAQASPVDYEVFWITNQIYIRNAETELIEQIAAVESVTAISEEFEVKLIEPIVHVESIPRAPGILAEWGVDNIEAPLAWALPGGNSGEGVIVASIDTGGYATHSDISGSFAGTNYGWRDVTLFGTQVPRDDNGHGSHTIGTMVGANGIGVAPSAKWIACKALNGQGSGTNAGLISCGQWVACPTLPNGNSPDCTRAPHVVSNSWGGGQANPFYNEVINAWHAANIVPVFANGNSGEACQTANSPADSLAGVIGVGATDVDNALAYFSSKGPTAGGRQKPDISAPGLAIRSIWNNGTSEYATISGTSMATPHVTGVVALLKAQNPNLTWEQVAKILYDTANKNVVETGMNCGGIPESNFPNMAFGHGIINAKNALQAAIDGKY